MSVIGSVPTKYEIYRNSEEWRDIAEKVKKRDGYRCVHCGSDKNLNVHHLTYKNIYHEELHDLITLCNHCHSAYHDIAKRTQFCIEQYYPSEDTLEAQMKHREEERKRIEEISRKIIDDFKAEGWKNDYCKNGDLDLVDFKIINKYLDAMQKKYNPEYIIVNKTDLQRWVMYRRAEFFGRCLDKEIELDRMVNETKFSESYLNKYYSWKMVNQLLKEEHTLREITK